MPLSKKSKYFSGISNKCDKLRIMTFCLKTEVFTFGIGEFLGLDFRMSHKMLNIFINSLFHEIAVMKQSKYCQTKHLY